MADLKPCPFCGRMPVLQADIRYPRPEYAPQQAYEVICQNSECIIGFVDECYRLTEREIVELWNRRKPHEENPHAI